MPSDRLEIVESDLITIVVSRHQVRGQRTSGVLDVLQSCLASEATVRENFERLTIAYHGYDRDSHELWEIPDVRDYVRRLDEDFPYWLFFLTKRTTGLIATALCLLPPFLSERGRETVLPQRLAELLERRWFPAMNEMCTRAKFDDDQVYALSDRVAEYFANGPQRV